MMSNNKILTVSYGTFSCTLEGFDDSFGTMKAIAEYFRDLSADDRYFGAEPAQPDAEMLTRIAEREISRRVEAREHDGRIVLSASDETPEAAPATLAGSAALEGPAALEAAPGALVGATALAAGSAALAGAAALAAQPEAEAPAPVEEPAAEEIPQVEDIAPAPTQVDEEVIADTDEAEAVEDINPDAVSQDDVAVDVSVPDAAEVVAEAVEEIETVEEIEAVEALDEAEAFFASSDTPMVEEDENNIAAEAQSAPEAAQADAIDAQADVDVADADADSDDAEPAEAATDSIAAKLQRIRAVVSQSQQQTEDDELFEDEHADDVDAAQTDADTIDAVLDVADGADANPADPADIIADAARDIEDAARVDEEIAAAAEDDEDQDLAALLARFDTTDDTAEDGTSDAIEQASDTVAAQTDTSADQSEDDLGLDTLAALMAADDGTADPDDQDENLFEDAQEPEVEAIDAEPTEAPVAPRRARIVKVKRAEIDAALASGQLEEVADDDVQTTGLSKDDEADLRAELAQVEAELHRDAAEPVEDQATKEEDEIVEQGDLAKPREDDAAEIKDDDVSRLMAEADNQMDEPEGTSRRSAFAHLKAAVMAKKADADIGNDSIKDEGAFRSDLASVVKPRRPAAGGTRDERPEGPRPAPLKLVAEQRVDATPEPTGPVRPRRVAAVQETEAEVGADGGFADYAADLGAQNLPDLLEAAASYLSFVEGRDQFSRPQLMSKVRQADTEDFSREDRLRSFGQLLRAGKIERIKGGRFAVTDDIGYRPEARAAG